MGGDRNCAQSLVRQKQGAGRVSLAVGPQYSSLGTQPILCASIPGLVPKQLRFCRNYVEIMPSVAEGIKISIQECQHQFRGRRWNCTTINNSLAIFGPVLDKGTRAPVPPQPCLPFTVPRYRAASLAPDAHVGAQGPAWEEAAAPPTASPTQPCRVLPSKSSLFAATRESAFVHAIASAGVAFAVTRSCAEGSAAICGCSSRHQGSPGEGWKWGGCSEDIEFGGMVSREFADARENRPDARSAMNRHNNEAGRQAIASHMHLKCKCHGLSGSCEVKTCWWSQPDFRAIGDFLKDKYDSASEMVVEKHRESRGWVETLRPRYTYFKVPTERDLVYYEASPNFCEPNPETGSFGTRDRTCNVSSHGIDGCDLLCCGRGHNARTEQRREKCHCVFHWCCYVSCQECARVYDVHTCK
ncbi:protein Wnt-3a [Bos indicus]|uniref:Protein Wnt n=1 Tax=Bos indicus TaxID=9915 RepID=A0ABM4SKH2_BOSIN